MGVVVAGGVIVEVVVISGVGVVVVSDVGVVVGSGEGVGVSVVPPHFSLLLVRLPSLQKNLSYMQLHTICTLMFENQC